jgi:hypothetical protein
VIKTAKQERQLKLAIRNGVARRSAGFVFNAVLEKLFDAGNVPSAARKRASERRGLWQSRTRKPLKWSPNAREVALGETGPSFPRTPFIPDNVSE